MFYSLLGRVAWFVAKRFLRRRSGPKPVLAGGTLALAAALVALRGRLN
ncbi:hypothetical protein [Candidatus Solirubrobacter pratensis]|nr:hypothetical protein [Candidatus Solirubrobacter pratensis]